MFAPLALLASFDKKFLPAAKKAVAFHASTTSAEDASWLINWRYMAAAIVISEYALTLPEKAERKQLKKELQEIYAFLHSSQYTDLAQLSPKVQETHPHSVPKNALDSHGGWGHNKGFEGYGPIAMITGQGALSFSLMGEMGLEIDAERHQAAFAFLQRGTGKNGYTWYEDSVAGDDNYADMGRTGASALAHALPPNPDHKKFAHKQAKLIAQFPEPFPDTHGSPLIGMGFAALGAFAGGEGPYRALMEANQWWFTLAQCADGTFYYQPNRDNAGYGPNSRLTASATVALIQSIPDRSLRITGKP